MSVPPQLRRERLCTPKENAYDNVSSEDGQTTTLDCFSLSRISKLLPSCPRLGMGGAQARVKVYGAPVSLKVRRHNASCRPQNVRPVTSLLPPTPLLRRITVLCLCRPCVASVSAYPALLDNFPFWMHKFLIPKISNKKMKRVGFPQNEIIYSQ